MPSFGAESMKQLATLHPDLKGLLIIAIKHVDFKIDCGHRGQEAQHQAFLSGASEKDWPNSKHNKFPSEAADLLLYYPQGQHIRWNEKENQYLFMGFMKGLASAMGLKVRIGADWDGDFDIKDQRFHDLPHIEIILGG
jgi:hypothetical protein